MRTPVLLIFCLNLVHFNIQAQTLKQQLCNHSWAQRPSSAIWNFTENGSFSAILFWGDKKHFGFTAKKGTYTLDESAKIMKITFDSSYTVYSKDSSSAGKDSGLQEWHFTNITNRKITLSRPPVWEFEKKEAGNADENLPVTLEAGKKRKTSNTKNRF